MDTKTTTWRFPRAFWVANGAELFERAAFYGTFIALALYLTRVVGLSDHAAGWVAGLFGALLYLFPFFTGALADRMGFRAALILAFALLAAGYGSLGFFHSLGMVLPALFFIVLGGAFVKPIITGTVAKSSDAVNRARAYSIFYMMVNIGSFSGKTVVKSIREDLGVGLVPRFSAAMALAALVWVILFYHPPARKGEERPGSMRETLKGMLQALSNGRFLAFILITACFWTIQHQLYASMPKYVLRLVGEHAAPEWYANVNPLVVVLLVIPITQLVRRWRAEAALTVSMALVGVAALVMALSRLFTGHFHLLGLTLHPITVTMIGGIVVLGVAECFLSPKYLEFASRQAPPGKEGLFLGYAHINSFFANLLGFVSSGYLLEAFCPDPHTLPAAQQAAREAALAGKGTMPGVYAHAHYIWYAYAGLGFLAFLALMVLFVLSGKKAQQT